jgi:acetyl-CoA carboxylase carboxyl transferase subunit beta
MGWFTRKQKKDAVAAEPKEDIWVKCPACHAHVFKAEWDKNQEVCPRCSYHERVTCHERVDLIIDSGSFEELNAKVTTSDPLQFSDGKGSYADKAKEAREKTGMNEAVLTGAGKINGIRAVVAVMDFRFLGGSLGSGTGEKIAQAANYALKHRLPYIVFSASGGARMHEGIISLMQMAKTCAAVARLKQEGLPYISVLTDPTTGGVSASFAMVGDINIAEPKALIGFAGRRVIEQTIKQKLPDEFQTAEYLLEHGFIDLIVERKKMKDTLHAILQYAVRN